MYLQSYVWLLEWLKWNIEIKCNLGMT